MGAVAEGDVGSFEGLQGEGGDELFGSIWSG